MPARIDDDKRAAILADIEAGQLSRNAIARKHGVAQGTVSNIADENGNNGNAVSTGAVETRGHQR